MSNQYRQGIDDTEERLQPEIDRLRSLLREAMVTLQEYAACIPTETGLERVMTLVADINAALSHAPESQVCGEEWNLGEPCKLPKGHSGSHVYQRGTTSTSQATRSKR